MAPPRVEVEIEGRTLSLSNLDKVLYPEVGFTKGQVIDYYTRIAPAVLPHLRDRPLTLKRYPNGVDGQFFYEKQCPKHRPEWVRTSPVWSRHAKRTIDFCVVDDLATLVWTSNLADLELHTSLARVDDVTAPVILAFDLDPGPPATIVQCAEVAVRLREIFERLGLACFAKTSRSCSATRAHSTIVAGGPGSRSKARIVGARGSDAFASDVCSSRSARLASHTSVGRSLASVKSIVRELLRLKTAEVCTHSGRWLGLCFS